MRPQIVWWRRLLDFVGPLRKLRIVEGDSLPAKLPFRDLVLARDGQEDWSVGLRCPCGCGERLEMMLLQGVKPRWDVMLDDKGRVSLYPSVWLRTGCRSHFWIRRGKIVWCD
ncbi:DUF6527 family protein [Bradyrhizobium sp. CCGB01]|uniref:DUF6527 family protein n=1 Tax=Bradyrhizobium sp. CCGB01 TaxID=2949634 RepID=UPI0020B36C03|nr:DUF6527 family protein [Bradyrhizobium sp. CCGB01]MCP3404053.1 DUF6527 family protein [Bradyrhizobium sp. CCGB01]